VVFGVIEHSLSTVLLFIVNAVWDSIHYSRF
jgi:hypothetical protein